MPTEDYNVDPIKNTGDPRTTSATAGPASFCPKHPVTSTARNATPRYRSRGLKRPAFCAHCNFNLRAWRRAKQHPRLERAFPVDAPRSTWNSPQPQQQPRAARADRSRNTMARLALVKPICCLS